ncbi:hypothetical protein K3495_g90 [Podosphaera aphanis]|nr:hypothetical protein K3495_g90 [Podosphaera aphanis]
MELIFPKGTITWKSRGSRSTLDLIFVSKPLEEIVVKCQTSTELEALSDHLPVQTELLIEIPRKIVEEPRPQWKKAKWDIVNKRIAVKLEQLARNNDPLSSKETIDQMVSNIAAIINETVEQLIPKAKPSQFTKPYWKTECSRRFQEARSARRKWTQENSLESWIEYNKATNRKKIQIRIDKMIGWRTTISEASKDLRKVWKLAKWAKKDKEGKRRLPQIPDIKDAEGNIYTESLNKVNVMAQQFFPLPVIADVQDIAGFTYPEELKTIPNVITQQDIEEALRKLPNDKAPGSNGIPNRLLKNCSKTLSKVLAELFNACLRLGYHPNKFKESTTIVTRKPQKPSYDTPKSYRLIALLKTMGKLLKKLVANRISDAAEKYNLIPDEQMGARPKRSCQTLKCSELGYFQL